MASRCFLSVFPSVSVLFSSLVLLLTSRLALEMVIFEHPRQQILRLPHILRGIAGEDGSLVSHGVGLSPEFPHSRIFLVLIPQTEDYPY